MKLIEKLLASSLAMLILALPNWAAAQDAQVIDLELRGGSLVTDVKGALAAGDTDIYALGLVAGKQVTVNVSGGADFTVQPPDGSAAIEPTGRVRQKRAQFTAVVDGDYIIAMTLADFLAGEGDAEFGYDMHIIVSRLPE